MNQLPDAFLSRMKEMLKDEYTAFEASYSLPRQYGLRVNTLKISPEEFQRISPFHLTPIPWIPNGFFYPEEDRPARHPYYYAGLYYLQEPSAMTPASRLEIQPGDRVLDLCAAPGGKATELGARLRGEGLLAANEISNSRAKALLKNIELFGIPNSFVLNEVPYRLAEVFPEYFNKILVDAPCSGEGMFRKDPAVAGTWTPERPKEFAKLQREILPAAAAMLSPGGLLLYSTCTFSPDENEGVISFLLESNPQLRLLQMEGYEGFSQGKPDWGNGNPELQKCVRIWPHRMNGEGHFMALFQKEGIPLKHSGTEGSLRLRKEDRKNLDAFFQDVTMPLDWSRVEVRGSKAYYLPSPCPAVRGPRFLRNGLCLGELKKNRFEPGQPLALAMKKNHYPSVLSLVPEDPRVIRYLKGETLSVERHETSRSEGYQLVCVDDFPLGWGKLVRGVLKNKYPAGWRIR
ncbi:RsmB/NOP family class I SAM-dependent RNA methyltransferase [Lactonifactor longoviformis]|uniref:RsmF rRNA methyltransferase first C-terminal domain-containing protein n=1 Tax=Lactonifactor longoviformis TaxID=341220 RepID=UPI00210CDEFA|nr:RsmB/NOP family class I SAM-dependent RNA methyltransferase [Lactonifactor longoviformis]MCQ4673090.1 RsmB/NOP family class I SAM-dependent RNA methyltransferase [Lactonifactor longoviformis]